MVFNVNDFMMGFSGGIVIGVMASLIFMKQLFTRRKNNENEEDKV